MFLYVYKQIFCISEVHISQKVKGVTMYNLHDTVFMCRWMYCTIFISAFSYLHFFHNFNIRAEHKAEKYVDSIWSLPIGIKIRWTSSLEELLAYTSSHMFIYFVSCYYSTSKMFKLLFILFVIKQLLGNVTSEINIYSATQSIIWQKKDE